MDFKSILDQEQILLLESGVRVPKGTKSAKILHHDDFDGLMSAIAIGMQLKKQGVDKIETVLLHDRDDEKTQMKKLKKRPGQINVVVDFDRFIDAEGADKKIDIQSDHHASDRKSSTGKNFDSSFGSDAMHISSKMARGFMNNTDLKAITAVDSAKFGDNVSTNIYLQKELGKKDGSQNAKTRLAIITSSIVNQLMRSAKTKNPGAVQSIIQKAIKHPTVLNIYKETMKHVDLQKKQVELLKAYEGKPSGEIDWAAIESFNKTAPKQMQIAIDKDKTGENFRLRKGKETGRGEAPTEAELGLRNRTSQVKKNLDIDDDGKTELKSVDPGDADMPPWDVKDKFKPISRQEKSRIWNVSSKAAEKKAGKDKWKAMSKEEQKKLIIPGWKKLMNEVQKDTPGILRKTENVAVQKDMKGNRYLSFEDPKIAAQIRDFWKFWQMSMRPDYYAKFKKAAEAKGKKFEPEEIDLVTLGKKAMTMAKDEMFTVAELKKRGFDKPNEVVALLNKTFKQDFDKSGGHKGITNIPHSAIYGVTADKYAAAAKKAKALGKRKNLPPETKKRLEAIEKQMEAKKKLYSTFLREYKERVQTLLTQAVQGRVNRTKSALTKTLKEDILNSVNF
ncbi:MAG: hypothetical protein DRJ01_00350 [Bacteroidetes bacterium]|nr:MAG: hypothetical protein DRJ01_00350 [Bacteroidota bacterium]